RTAGAHVECDVARISPTVVDTPLSGVAVAVRADDVRQTVAVEVGYLRRQTHVAYGILLRPYSSLIRTVDLGGFGELDPIQVVQYHARGCRGQMPAGFRIPDTPVSGDAAPLNVLHVSDFVATVAI